MDTMTTGPAVMAAVLAAAVLHASWNALAKHSQDRLGMFARTSIVGAAIAGPVLVFVDPPARVSWPWLAGSVAVHVLYNLGLLAAYRLGDFNQTYPLARGLGPVVVAVVAVPALGEPLVGLPAAGVALIAGAIAVLGLTPWQQVRQNRPAVLAAMGTGLTIAGYTLLDGIGVRLSGSSFGYTLWLLGTHSLVTVLALAALSRVVLRRAPAKLPRREAVAAVSAAVPTASATREPDAANSRKADMERAEANRVTTSGLAAWGVAALACLMSMLAYGLVLWAQTRGALAAVAALRESSVVVAAVIGVLFFKEPLGRVRTAAAVAVAAGIVLLALPA
jgi:drug/metabolite transporter (DMT)-like permease